ncbi:RNA polymerase I subunit Rpa43 [Aspergillus terreus]|uniref:DNA-directed RNA polymerase subunit n=1 Tax=Aspergillus terreus TaxID=33178 RepID=A0A5M3YP52_ASPTE|nr:hypothetical protein ATETN484_0001098800 [Aspergillus terreus]GFF12843.1 RNA polymerase I subunit Rpa43 [Aspergillus terreus]
MAVDEMDIDSQPVSTVPETDKERKRKHKTKDTSSSSPSKKKRKHESSAAAEPASPQEKTKSDRTKTSNPQSTTASNPADSPYTLTTATLYLPLSPISISPTHALASLLAEHLSPLLLTYYPPLQGIVLAYSNPSISSTPPASSPAADPQDPNPQPLTLAKTAGEYGVLYVYLTATFLVFRPRRGHILEGWVNVQSEGFLGAVVLNLFSVGIERKRLPSNWRWVPPGEEADDTDADKHPRTEDEDSEPAAPFNPDKEHFTPVSLASDANPLSDMAAADQTAAGDDDDAVAEGYFRSVSGHRVRGTVRFRVVDIDVIPGSERERGFISIEGTMLSPEEEAKVLEDERNGVVTSFATPRASKSATPAALPASNAAADAEASAVADTPSKTKTKEPKQEKEKKSKKSSKSKKEK